MNRSQFVLCCALALNMVVLKPPGEIAAGPLDLPTAAGLSPGDVLIYDLINDWIKFDPTSNQLYSLPWPRQTFNAPRQLAIDLDGSLLFDSGVNSVARIHPVTGASTPLTPSIPRGFGFALLADGDFLLFKPATDSSRTGDVWSGGLDSILARFDRDTGVMSPITKPQHFSPRGIVVGPNGEVYVDEFFRGIQRIDLATGELSNFPPPASSIDRAIGIFPDGDIATHHPFLGIDRIDSTSGLRTSLIRDRELGFGPATMDESGDIWTTWDSKLYLIDGATGEKETRLDGRGVLLPQLMLVIPSDWSPPPIPEPSAMALALIAIGGMAMNRNRYP